MRSAILGIGSSPVGKLVVRPLEPGGSWRRCRSRRLRSRFCSRGGLRCGVDEAPVGVFLGTLEPGIAGIEAGYLERHVLGARAHADDAAVGCLDELELLAGHRIEVELA